MHYFQEENRLSWKFPEKIRANGKRDYDREKLLYPGIFFLFSVNMSEYIHTRNTFPPLDKPIRFFHVCVSIKSPSLLSRRTHKGERPLSASFQLSMH